MDPVAAGPFSTDVLDAELLWRRIHPDHLVSDGQGGQRLSSAAFKDPSMSVDREAIVTALGETHSFTRRQGVGVAEFTAGLARSMQQTVVYKPVEDNPAHTLVEGQKSQSIARGLARKSILHR